MTVGYSLDIARTELMDWYDEKRERVYAAHLFLADEMEKESKMLWIKELYEEGNQVIEELRTARISQFVAIIALGATEEKFRGVQASIEQAIVNEAGGDKALGSNAEARKRALAASLVESESYDQAVMELNLCRAETKDHETHILGLRDRLSLIKAVLYANAGFLE